MRLIAFHQSAFDDYNQWAKTDKKLFERIRRIIIETASTPFDGIGKPEPLKHELKGYWSRRLTDEHRPVYKVTEEQIIIISGSGSVSNRTHRRDAERRRGLAES